MKKLSLRKKLYDAHTGRELSLFYKFPNGNLIVVDETANFARTVDAYGYNLAPANRPDLRKPRVLNSVPEEVEYWSIYPNGQIYTKTDGPVRTSSYGIENLVQVKITRRQGRVVKKEFV
jgi:hypothetical protein